MIDLNEIEKYKENSQIEAKKASGGLPHSVWNTYSSFANTFGGIILLGVEETADKTLRVNGLSDPEKMIKDFWDIINNINKVSVNILSEKDVTIENINGKSIVAIRVPRAQRSDKPVYLENNPLLGSYRRNGEGDYKCTKEEVQAMMRDAAIKSQDMIVLENMNLDVFDYDSIKRYRNRMKIYRPGHVWEEIDVEDFLYRIGAVGRSNDGKLHPTTAGLLMFGYEYEIIKEFSSYFLDYQEQFDLDSRWSDRIISSSGDWSGNLYDFYFRVYNKLSQNIKTPFKLEGGNRIDDTPVHKALREVLANTLINADYYGSQGLVIINKRDRIIISNPGTFRLDLNEAKSGGVSDPRNSTLMKMFNLIDIGERAGSGIPNIFSTWEKQGWPAPIFSESFEPDRITLTLKFGEYYQKNAMSVNDNNYKIVKSIDDKKTSIKTGDKKPVIKTGDKKPTIKLDNKDTKKAIEQKQKIILYLTKNIYSNSKQISELLELKSSRTREILLELVNEGIIITEGNNKNRIYKLK